MKDFFQGDIIKINGYKPLFLVISKNSFIKNERMLHVCPIVNTDSVNPLHISIKGKDGAEGTAICEEIKLIDPEARICSKVDRINYGQIMYISDALQSIFEYD